MDAQQLRLRAPCAITTKPFSVYYPIIGPAGLMSYSLVLNQVRRLQQMLDPVRLCG